MDEVQLIYRLSPSDSEKFLKRLEEEPTGPTPALQRARALSEELLMKDQAKNEPT